MGNRSVSTKITRILDVFTYAPGSYRKNAYALPVNIIIMCMILVRCISVGYFVMGLVWKLHTGLIQDSWIDILNRLWIGNLRLGITVNALVLTSVSLFPVYVISCALGMLGIFCRKRIFVILYMLSLLIFLGTDMIYISIFSILLDEMESSSLPADFQSIFHERINYPDSPKEAIGDWMTFFSTTCWEKFSRKMISYCSSFLSLAVLCLLLELIQLGFCDIIYSNLSGQKLPFALARTCLSKIITAWQRSWSCVIANIWRLLSCLPSIGLVTLGAMLLNDSQMRGSFVDPIYVHIYILGLNFMDIIRGLGVLMITLGVLEFIANISAVIADCVVQNKTKSGMGCLDKIQNIIGFYTTGFFIAISISILFEGLSVLFTIFQIRSMPSKDVHDNHNLQNNSSDESRDEENKGICKQCFQYCKSDFPRLILMVAAALSVLFGVVFIMEGLILSYDKVFNHDIIKDVIFSALSFNTLSFNHIRTSFCAFMFSSGIILIIFCGIGMFTLRKKSKCLHVTQAIVVSIALALMIIGTGLWGKIKDTISYRIADEMTLFLLNHQYNSHISYVYSYSTHGAWSNLFSVAECCGVDDYVGSELVTYLSSNDKIPIFCCKENPLTEPYQTNNDYCTDLVDPDMSYNTIIQLTLIIYQLRKRQFLPLQSDKYFNLFKTKRKWRQILILEWKTLFIFLSMLSSLSMLVLGIVLMRDTKMTGSNVYHVYKYLYLQGVNFVDIVEAMYLSLIMLGVLSMTSGLVGLSEMFRDIRSEVKMKFYVLVLVILIFTKLVCIFLMIPVQGEIETDSSETNYQLVNIDRQYSNPRSSIYTDLNKFYLELDCCGSTGSNGFRSLVINAGYGSVTGYQPYVCCLGQDYVTSNGLYGVQCEKKACGAEFVSIANIYCNGLIASMSITSFLEIICLVFSILYLKSNENQKENMLSLGGFAESAAFLYDDVFSNRQIQPIFEKMSMAGNSFSRNLIIMRWLMNTTGVLLFVSSVFSILTIHQGSKFLHSMNILVCVLGLPMILTNLGWWIAVHVENFPEGFLINSNFDFYSLLSDCYRMDETGAWNNLFVKLQCCGYTNGNESDFYSVVLQTTSTYNGHQDKTPLFCCHSNPLTKEYNSDFTTCTSYGGEAYRYTEPCSTKLSDRLTKYSTVFYTIASLSIILEVFMLVLLGKLIKTDLPLKEDPFLIKINSYFGKDRKRKRNLENSTKENLEMSPRGGKQRNNSEKENSHTPEFQESKDDRSQASKKRKGAKRSGRVTPISDEHDDQLTRRELLPTKLPPLVTPSSLRT
ncbi:uncharacterized protein LOC133182506 [Saccostrea echinata]|uniref:uncharacterized protein LOC133182506 n=1 Tax=Saccostrea echinata TaxID=191078 RepID=UPI002A81CF46|nr:uncharacterized protein LOC133182506 [Saccostrea echinata]